VYTIQYTDLNTRSSRIGIRQYYIDSNNNNVSLRTSGRGFDDGVRFGWQRFGTREETGCRANPSYLRGQNTDGVQRRNGVTGLYRRRLWRIVMECERDGVGDEPQEVYVYEDRVHNNINAAERRARGFIEPTRNYMACDAICQRPE